MSVETNKSHFDLMDVLSESWGPTTDTYATAKVGVEVVRNEVAFVAVDVIRDARAWMQEQRIELEAYKVKQAEKAMTMRSVEARLDERLEKKGAKQIAAPASVTLQSANGEEELSMGEFMAITLTTMNRLTAEVAALKAGVAAPAAEAAAV